ncbi:MAG TPA: nuclear transport factor 2 family protein [Steroidobacteraceae bacterium]|nr:nuclear transport factor 2 family protein [Steroidobacteraceae bacterium]
MSLTRRTLLSVAAAVPALAGWTANAAESDLDDAVRTYDQATVHNDVAALAQLVRDDYFLVNSDSTLQDKQSYLKDFEVPGFKLDPYVLEQPVRRVWGDTALVAGVVHLSWTLQGEHQTRLLRIAHVWTKLEGRWRLAYTQLTRVPQQ